MVTVTVTVTVTVHLFRQKWARFMVPARRWWWLSYSPLWSFCTNFGDKRTQSRSQSRSRSRSQSRKGYGQNNQLWVWWLVGGSPIFMIFLNSKSEDQRIVSKVYFKLLEKQEKTDHTPTHTLYIYIYIYIYIYHNIYVYIYIYMCVCVSVFLGIV